MRDGGYRYGQGTWMGWVIRMEGRGYGIFFEMDGVGLEVGGIMLFTNYGYYLIKKMKTKKKKLTGKLATGENVEVF